MEKNLLKNKDPLVSVCVPAYNCERYIRITLNCLLEQSYPNLEIIVVDDGSTDGTAAAIGTMNDSRLSLINSRNGGAAAARNTAYKFSKGEYIIFFDADDYISPLFISSQLDIIGDKKDITVLSAWGRFHHDDINTLRVNETTQKEMTFPDWIRYYWYYCNPMTNPGRAIIPRGLIEAAGLWNESLSLNDDLEFFTRVFIKSSKIVFNNSAVFCYRSGIKGLSSQVGDIAYQSLFDSIRLSVDIVLFTYENESSLVKSCANMWQSFIYLVYPYQTRYLKLAKSEIQRLSVPDLKFQTSGVTGLLVLIFGWKLTKNIKLLFTKFF